MRSVVLFDAGAWSSYVPAAHVVILSQKLFLPSFWKCPSSQGVQLAALSRSEYRPGAQSSQTLLPPLFDVKVPGLQRPQYPSNAPPHDLTDALPAHSSFAHALQLAWPAWFWNQGLLHCVQLEVPG